jgi:hypothetical protein
MLSGSLSPQHGASSGRGRRDGLQLWRVAVNVLNKQPQTKGKEWSSSLRVVTVAKELARYRSDGRAVALNLWENTHFSAEMGMRIQGFPPPHWGLMRVEFVSDRKHQWDTQ